MDGGRSIIGIGWPIIPIIGIRIVVGVRTESGRSENAGSNAKGNRRIPSPTPG
jgi:hypothetical protein